MDFIQFRFKAALAVLLMTGAKALAAPADVPAPAPSPGTCLAQALKADRYHEQRLTAEVEQILAKIAPARRAAAKPEFRELLSCFALNQGQNQAAFQAQDDLGFSDAELNSRLKTAYVARAALTERKLALLDRYGVLSLSGFEAKTLTAVLATHRARTANILRMGKFFLRGATTTASLPSVFEKAWAKLSLIRPAYAAGMSVFVRYFGPEERCDGKAHWRITYVRVSESESQPGPDGAGNLFRFRLRDRCAELGKPVVEASVEALDYFKYAKSEHIEDVHFSFEDGRTWSDRIYGSKLFMGVASHEKFCQTFPVQLDSSGNALPGQKPRCAWVRYGLPGPKLEPVFEDELFGGAPQFIPEGKDNMTFKVPREGIWVFPAASGHHVTEITYSK